MGILLPIHSDFILLTPINILVALFFVLDNHPNNRRALGLGLLGCYVAGFLIELVGVQTGAIFGKYSYGGTLGFKVWGTPLMMGLNWAMLLYLTTAITYHWMPDTDLKTRAATAAALMLGMDIFIEPVAIRYDFWTWHEPGINAFLVAPLQNYIAWWMTAYPLLVFFQWLNPRFENRVAEALFAIQLVFFMVLGMA